MRILFVPVILAALLNAPAIASVQVHIALKATAVVVASQDGFFSLGAVADLTGGTSTERDKLSDVTVGRAPLPNEIRHLTRGDIRLKLRQAGYRPSAVAVIDGADQSQITVNAGPGQSGPASTVNPQNPGAQNTASGTQPPADVPQVHRGDSVTIMIQNGDMTVTAPGQARESGKIGDRIHVHRDGVMVDLMATVVDAQTVRLEL